MLCRKAQTGSGQMKVLFLLLVLYSHLPHPAHWCSHFLTFVGFFPPFILLPKSPPMFFSLTFPALSYFYCIELFTHSLASYSSSVNCDLPKATIDNESSSHQTHQIHFQMGSCSLILTIMSKVGVMSLGSFCLMHRRMK